MECIIAGNASKGSSLSIAPISKGSVVCYNAIHELFSLALSLLKVLLGAMHVRCLPGGSLGGGD